MTILHENGRLRRGARWVVTLALGASPLLAACNTDNFLKVSAPTQIPAEGLENPGAAPLLVNGAAADFECAVGNFALVEGIISDEFADAQLGAAGYDYDRRTANMDPNGIYGTYNCEQNQMPGLYVGVATARWSADNALKAVQALPAGTANLDSLVAAAALYAGFDYGMLGMAFCEAAVDLSKAYSQAELFAMAEQKFTTAIEAATRANAAALKNAALVGRARMRLFQGNKSGADADAKLVPAGFTFVATASESKNRRYNRIFAATGKYGFYTVEAQSSALTTEGVADPRSAVQNTGIRGMDGSTIWDVKRYASLSTPLRVATWDEAQLIMAEAEGGTAAVTLINGLRDAYGLAHYSGATDAASITRLIIEERRKTLFAEGQRNYDFARFGQTLIPFNPAVGASFKDGSGTYGNTTCLPVPNSERFNNPNIG